MVRLKVTALAFAVLSSAAMLRLGKLPASINVADRTGLPGMRIVGTTAF